MARGGHPGRWGKRYASKRKVFVRSFLADVLGLHPGHVSRLFSPTYDPSDVREYLSINGYRLRSKGRVRG